jgi:hypothetical protein
MALQVRTRLTPGYDWKSILVEDITGTGITGYGTLQNPTSRRNTSNIVMVKEIFTSPSDILYNFNQTLLPSGYTFVNTVLGQTIDEPLEDGLWKVEYLVNFTNASTINVVNGSKNFTVSSNANQDFNNVKYIYDVANATYYSIASLNLATLSGTFTNNWSGATNAALSNYNVVFSSILYVPIAREIKECLDGKVADLSVCDCGCLELQTIKLVNMYLLYDAMFDNCVANNVTKAQQIFDLLTTYCDKDCGCNS